MVSVIIKGDSSTELTEEQAIKMSRERKVFPCHFCGTNFSHDEIRFPIVVDEQVRWIHKRCIDVRDIHTNR